MNFAAQPSVFALQHGKAPCRTLEFLTSLERPREPTVTDQCIEKECACQEHQREPNLPRTTALLVYFHRRRPLCHHHREEQYQRTTKSTRKKKKGKRKKLVHPGRGDTSCGTPPGTA